MDPDIAICDSTCSTRSDNSLIYLQGKVSQGTDNWEVRCKKYPLLGPRFMGTLLKEHDWPMRLQLEQVFTLPSSAVASHRIWRRIVSGSP